MSTKSVKASPEQVTYANLLYYGCWGSLALMLVTYLVYAFGILPPHIPMDVITQLWSQRVGVYLAQGNVPTGWGWTALLAKGDFLNFTGIVLLAGMTIVCYLTLIPAFIKKKDPLMATIATLEVIVLCVAASGIFGSGGH